MANYRRNEITSGAFVLLALAVFALFAFKVGGLDLFWFARGETRSFEILLPDVKGLEEGARVTFGGRRVGKITKITVALPGDVQKFKDRYEAAWGVECEGLDSEEGITFMMMSVVFELEADEFEGEGGEPVRVHGPTASAVLLAESLLGGHFLQFQPGQAGFWKEAKPVFGAGSPEIDGPIPIRGRSEDLMDVVRQEIHPTLSLVEHLLQKVNEEILSDANLKKISGTLAELEAAVAGLRKFADTLPGTVDGTRADLNAKVLDPLNRLLTNTDGSITELKREIVEQVVAEAKKTLEQGTRALDSAARAMAQAESVLEDGGPKAVATLENLRTTTAGLDARLDSLQGKLDEILRHVDYLVAENRPEVADTLQTLRRAAWEVEMLMRKVRSNPALILFGDDEEDLGAAPFDASGLRRSGRAKPYEQRDESESGD